MKLEFSLEEMKTTLNVMTEQTSKYIDAIEIIDTTIKNLEKYWVSNETKTYEVFIEKYKEKQKQLLEAKILMQEFCEKLNEKIIEFEETTTSTINSFE